MLKGKAASINKLVCDLKNNMQRSVTEKDIEQRFVDLSVMAKLFAEKYGNPRNITIETDERLLYLAVTSAMEDVERYKQYHLDDPSKNRSDAVKRAAFMTHWLRRFRPLRALSGSNGGFPANDDSFLINESFCILVACAYLGSDIQENISFPQEKTYELLYDFLYREISTDALILFFQTVKDIAKKKEVIVLG
jgi:hypothetical protein